jgi:hypothetical protein
LTFKYKGEDNEAGQVHPATSSSSGSHLQPTSRVTTSRMYVGKYFTSKGEFEEVCTRIYGYGIYVVLECLHKYCVYIYGIAIIIYALRMFDIAIFTYIRYCYV